MTQGSITDRSLGSVSRVEGRPAAGITFFPGMEPFLRDLGPLLDLVEIEPQVIWRPGPDPDAPFEVDPQALERFKAISLPKLLHGIGFPLGGSLPPDPRQLDPFRYMVAELEPLWVSEHLSFNRANGPDGAYVTGFLLPPRQSSRGVSAAARAIRRFQAELTVPVAVETGVNYLRSRPDELTDGAFVAAVADAADCGLLLDLHNIWTNERNGRQPVGAFVDELPVERVWEIHLAGGSEHRGFWLDSHSGAIPDDLKALAMSLIPRFPNLRAVIFEVYPDYLPELGTTGVVEQVRTLHDLLALPNVDAGGRSSAVAVAFRADDGPSPREWEDALGANVAGLAGDGALFDELRNDPGAELMAGLVREFRASMIERNLKFTTRYLRLTMTPERLQGILTDYWREVPPQLFASSEGALFGKFVSVALGDKDPLVRELAALDSAATATLADRRTRRVPFSVDPVVVLRALAEDRIPSSPPIGLFEMEITPERLSAEGTNFGSDLEVAAH